MGLQEGQGLCPSHVIKFIEYLRFLFLNKMLSMVFWKLFANRADAPHLGQSTWTKTYTGASRERSEWTTGSLLCTFLQLLTS